MENISYKMVCCYNRFDIKTSRICDSYKVRGTWSKNIIAYKDESNVGVLFNISISVHRKMRSN